MVTLPEVVAAGDAALEAARATRQQLRGASEPGDADREHELEVALLSIDNAMRPIRRLIGLLVWVPVPAHPEKRLRQVSHDLGEERKKLKRMRRL